jgi:hypothetical protein
MAERLRDCRLAKFVVILLEEPLDTLLLSWLLMLFPSPGTKGKVCGYIAGGTIRYTAFELAFDVVSEPRHEGHGVVRVE